MFCISIYSFGQITYGLNAETFIQSEHKTFPDYIEISIPDFSFTEKVGEPQIPVKYLRFALPKGMSASDIEITTREKQTFILEKDIFPVQEPIPTKRIEFEQKMTTPLVQIYQSNDPYPANKAEIFNEGLFDGDIPIVTIAVYPIQYFPKDRVVNFYPSIGIVLNYSQSDREVITKRNRGNRLIDYEKILKAKIDNDDAIEDFGLLEDSNQSSTLKSLSADFQYIIVTEDDLKYNFVEFLGWKRRKGIEIGLVTTENISSNYTGDLVSGINDEAGKLRQFLKDQYTNYGLEYALLGGDNNVVPIRYGCGSNNTLHSSPGDFWYYIPADIYFAEFHEDWKVDGDTLYGEITDDTPLGDYESEIYVGRLLCNSGGDIKNWTKKLLLYEMHPGLGDSLYLENAFFIQADQMQRDDDATLIANHMSNFTATIWEEEPSYNSADIPTFPTGAEAIDEINEGYGFISWLAHAGPPGIGIGTKGCNDRFCSDCKYNICALDSWDREGLSSTCIEEDGNGLDNLTNYGKPGIVYTMGCETTPFDLDFYWPSISTNLGQGWTTYSFAGGPAYLGNTRVGWLGPSQDLQLEFADVIDDDNIFNLGQVEAISKGNNTSDKHYLSYTHNLIGCPETEIWTSVPNVFNNVSISENGSSVTVTTNVAGSNICLMDAVYTGSSSYHDLQTGVSSYTFTNVPSQYNVTVTKHDYIPYTVNPETTHIQNVSISNMTVVEGSYIEAGSSVTQDITTGPVSIQSGSYVLLKPEESVTIEGDFTISSGGNFEISFN